MPFEEGHEERDNYEISNFFFMVKDQQGEVNLDEDETSFPYDELQDSFENLIEDFHKFWQTIFSIVDVQSLIKEVKFSKQENLIAIKKIESLNDELNSLKFENEKKNY